MAEAVHLLALDQGTTSTRAIVFDKEARPVVTARREFQQHYPAQGWVEHNPEDIWRDALATAREAIAASQGGARDWHRQSARNRGGLGSEDGCPRAPRDRLAGPPDGRRL